MESIISLDSLWIYAENDAAKLLAMHVFFCLHFSFPTVFFRVISLFPTMRQSFVRVLSSHCVKK